MHRSTWSRYLSIFLLIVPLTIDPTHAIAAPRLITQSNAEFDNYMKLGYTATIKRDYRNALVYFKKAQVIKPNNIYTDRAISNVTNYIEISNNRNGQNDATWISRGTGAPIQRISGGTRGQSCTSNKACLTSLLPDRIDGQLTTLADYPEILFYASKTTAPQMEFILTDEVEREIYSLNLATPKTDSMIRIDLSKLKSANGTVLPPLKVGRKYTWSFTILNETVDRSNNPILEGSILRQEVDPNLAEMLTKASPIDRISIYAVNNIWYDFVSSLYQQKLAQPTDREIARNWDNLLKDIKLTVEK
ncbi:DUF928 domain-containing protein [Chamaesiphon sp. VAR_48_metabat_403]|uniref:DUF928 domain-containing protein n=1 Tax=Chamaesiphon sp. VAR_48_metabat_403 TaxID=2964700 RepID=UPI00286E64CF|nr:DUF928 domain-containing protein [Chamaesiphon sp. VAR_48_metabat_403]